MRTVISYVSRYEDHFRAVMEQKLRLSSEAAIRGHKKRLAQAEKRLGELDRLFIRIYEDNVAERIQMKLRERYLLRIWCFPRKRSMRSKSADTFKSKSKYPYFS